MEAEFFETFDEDLQPIGLVERSVVHQRGLWHRAVHVLLFRSDGRLVIQRRSLKKDVCPGLWDLSAAEHLKPGETYLDGAKRGLFEELGVSGVELDPLATDLRAQLEIPESGVRDYELQATYSGRSDAKLVLQASEVMEVALVELEELEDAMRDAPNTFTPWFHETAAAVNLFRLPGR